MRQRSAATNPCGAIRHNVQKEVQKNGSYCKLRDRNDRFNEEGRGRHSTLKNVDEWGKRKLAYLINKESEGYYVLFDFESTAEFPAELDRVYKITEGVMRSLIIKKEDE